MQFHHFVWSQPRWYRLARWVRRVVFVAMVATVVCGIVTTGVISLVSWSVCTFLSIVLFVLSLLLLRRMTLYYLVTWIQLAVFIAMVAYAALAVANPQVPALMCWLIAATLFAMFMFARRLKSQLERSFLDEVQEQARADVERMQQYYRERDRDRE